MHRQPLLQMLERYADRHPGERATTARIAALVENQADCFERSCWPGHITASAWIVSPERGRFLLTHHRKLGRWLQLGGHSDGDPHVARTALREACEESGLADLRFGCLAGELMPIDVDVHAIPARANEPAHDHHDIRFLLWACASDVIRVSAESHALRWFPAEDLEPVCGAEESLLRLGRKAIANLAHVTWIDAAEIKLQGEAK